MLIRYCNAFWVFNLILKSLPLRPPFSLLHVQYRHDNWVLYAIPVTAIPPEIMEISKFNFGFVIRLGYIYIFFLIYKFFLLNKWVFKICNIYKQCGRQSGSQSLIGSGYFLLSLGGVVGACNIATITPL